MKKNMNNEARAEQEERLSYAAMMGSIWADAVVSDAEDVRDLPETYQAFLQMIANANCPVFPSFHSEEETDAAYDAAWERYCRLTGKEEEE